jgi:arylformamidase
MSGTYDLEPVMLSVRSSYVKLSKEEQWTMSAVRHVDRVTAPIALAIGENESPEFKRQAARFSEALNEASKQVSLVRVGGCNHFEMMDAFGDPRSEISACARKLMGLRG